MPKNTPKKFGGRAPPRELTRSPRHFAAMWAYFEGGRKGGMGGEMGRKDKGIPPKVKVNAINTERILIQRWSL